MASLKLPRGVIPEPLPWRTPKEEPAPVPPAPAAPQTAAEAAPKGKFGKLLAKKKAGAEAAAEAAAAPAAEKPSSPAEAAPLPAGGGKMLAYLKSAKARTETEGPLAKVLDEITRELRGRARAKGFADVYEVLRLKKSMFEKEMTRLEKGLTESAQNAFRKELDLLEKLLSSTVEEIWRLDPSIRELAEHDRGGLGGLKKELSNLFEELG